MCSLGDTSENVGMRLEGNFQGGYLSPRKLRWKQKTYPEPLRDSQEAGSY